MAICVGYFENQPPSPSMITVAGYVAPKARWGYFEERWPRALRAEHLTAFNGRDFGQGIGEFASGWIDDEARKARLIQALARLTEQHVRAAFSCSMRLEDYEAVNGEYRFAETASRPYGVCAARLIASVQYWMAVHHGGDLTLFVFEDGDVNQREIRRILVAEGIDRGEPAQLWPRKWVDEAGRRRLLRPFEACDLLTPQCGSEMLARLSRRQAVEQTVVSRDDLLRIGRVLGVTRRLASDLSEAGVAP